MSAPQSSPPRATPARTHPTLSTTEFARLVYASPKTIERRCSRGDIPGAARAGRLWRIPTAALTTYQKD